MTATQNYNLVPYKVDEQNTIQVTQFNEDVWLTQKQMAELFGCSKENIRLHLNSIFESQELDKNRTTKKILVVQNEGGREVSREKTFNNLDAIISVGYRVNSKRGILFRQWATKIIKERILNQYKDLPAQYKDLSAQYKCYEDKISSLSEKIQNYNYHIFQLNERILQLENKNRHNISVIKDSSTFIYERLFKAEETANELKKKVAKLENRFSNSKRKTFTVLTV